jgi:nitrite reductase/ring-hydroxylating ferredoxin subunit|tara:strand:+ start:20780 stop:21250 length:471 start_codon:yes stop_codon:yes gene_type:complete
LNLEKITSKNTNMHLEKLKLTIAVFLVSFGCSKTNDFDASCNFLANLNVVTTLNLNLSQYNQLTFPSNPVYVPNVGNGGIIVNNTGIGYVAFDAADPNHVFSECSVLAINGINAICGCEDNKYNLVTGQPMENPELRCSLKPYFVESNGNTLYISN